MQIQISDIIIRPIELEDYNMVLQMANFAQDGMTNLPREEATLSDKIHHSINSFKNPRLEGCQYMFVMEHTPSKMIVGLSAVKSQVGYFNPLIHFNQSSYASKDKTKTFDVLHIDSFTKGPSEVCSLYLRPDCRGQSIGRFLSLHRFLFMAPHQALFQKTVLAEMRGVSTKEGGSPFYSHVWEKRIHKPFVEADAFYAKDPKAIMEHAPMYPIEISMLSTWAKEVIGEPHNKTVPAYHLLQNQGLVFNNRICILDAGPMLECPIKDVSVVKNMSKIKISKSVEFYDESKYKLQSVMLSNGDLGSYRAGVGLLDGDTLVVSSSVLKQLKCKIGEEVYVSKLYS
jgi:arginine N-succinyltransferase